jgi:hypothetical protein
MQEKKRFFPKVGISAIAQRNKGKAYLPKRILGGDFLQPYLIQHSQSTFRGLGICQVV